MKRWLSYLAAMVVFAGCGLGLAAGQQGSRPGTVIVPPTNVELPQDIGRRAHTNFLIFVPAKKGGKRPYLGGTSPGGETPASLSCVYKTWAGQVNGCPINGSYNAPSGGTNAIAIVDAYDYPTAQSDFDTFSNTFGLPLSTTICANGQPCFTKVYARGSQPKSNCGWAQEAALDIEWAHAMAPHAQIILVEAATNSNADLMQAVQVASGLVANAGGGEVSMSWGGSEFSTQSTYDSDFNGTGVTYLASSGDTGGKVIWPSSSPNVVSAGGTSVNRDPNGNFTNETAWSSAGGGPSKYEPIPDYQSSIYSLAQLLNGYRGTPDLSFDADPYTGVSVYDSTRCQGLSGWLVFGGTSVSAPSLAGIANLSGNFSGNNGVQTSLYQNYSSVSSSGTSPNPYTDYFFDVTSGSAGNYPASPDWDFASGIGTVRGLSGLSGSTSSSPTVASVSLSPSTVTGGSPSTGTVTLSAAPTSDVTVNLSSDSTSASVPSSVTVLSGQTSAPFNVTTSSVTSTTSVTITASYNNSSAGATLTVNPASTGGGSFTISASNFSASRGSSGSTAVTVGPASGFTGTVTFNVSGVPPQSTASLPSVKISGTTSVSSTLTVTTGQHTPTKTYTLTITGTSGSLIQSTTVLLTVQ